MCSATARTRTLLSMLTLAFAVVWLSACGGGEPGAGDEGSAAGGDLVVSGFSTPESVLYDPEADVYLVSNINGTPVDKDGNGFISRVSPDGEVLDLHWIDSAPTAPLNAPKGLALQDSTLYVTDINCVRMYDRHSGASKGNACLEHATFLNDIAPGGDGTMFFTDSGLQMGDSGLEPDGSDAVYRLIDDDRIVAVKKDASLGAPNGITVGSRGILVVTFGSGEVYRLDADGNRTNMMPASDRQLDGIVSLPDGGFMMSSWGDSCVYRVGADGHVAKVVEDVEAPADIGYDSKRNRLLIPLFNASQVRIHDLG
ncbi:MAG: hypothetical protein PVJ02_08165 [Gemmatimonadota bacterium]